MTEDERLQHIGELKECLGSLLFLIQPPTGAVSLVMLSEAQQLRQAADRAEAKERLLQRAHDLIAKQV
jgi:hypothetical protein